MSLPEVPDFNAETFDFSEATMGRLMEEERRRRKRAAREVRAEFRRVELLGSDDSYRQSYHEILKPDSTQRVFVHAYMAPGLGRTFHVVSNIEWGMVDHSRQIFVEEYLKAESHSAVGYSSSLWERSPSSNNWMEENRAIGPLLFSRPDGLQIYCGPDCERAVFPDVNGEQTDLDRIDSRSESERLLALLRSLSEVTLDQHTILKRESK